MSVSHGNTTAAWTGVAIVLIGFLVAGIGLAFEYLPVFFAGVALGPVGAIVGYVMGKMGFGGDPVRR